MREYLKLVWHFFYLGINATLLGVSQSVGIAITIMPILSVVIIIEQMFQFVKSIIILVTFRDLELDVKINTFVYLRSKKLENIIIWLVQLVASFALFTIGYFLTSGIVFFGVLFQLSSYLKIMLDSEMQEIKDLETTKLSSMVKSVNSDLADIGGKYE